MKIALTVLVIVLMIGGSIAVMISGSDNSEPINEDSTRISPEEAKNMARTHLRENIIGAQDAEIIGLNLDGVLYVVEIDFLGDGSDIVNGYVTVDGAYFIPSAIRLKEDTTPVVGDGIYEGLEFSDSEINLLYFWGDGCPFCDMMHDFLEDLEEKWPDTLNIIKLETWNDLDNSALFRDVASLYGLERSGVPAVFVGDLYFVGASSAVFSDLENFLVENCLGQRENCVLKS